MSSLLILLIFILSTCFFIPTDNCAATSPVTSPTTTAAHCNTCTANLITEITTGDGYQPITSSIATNAAGCLAITFVCQRNPPNTADVSLITFYSPDVPPTQEDAGTADSTLTPGTASATLDCVNGHWERTDQNTGIAYEITEVECQIIV